MEMMENFLKEQRKVALRNNAAVVIQTAYHRFKMSPRRRLQHIGANDEYQVHLANFEKAIEKFRTARKELRADEEDSGKQQKQVEAPNLTAAIMQTTEQQGHTLDQVRNTENTIRTLSQLVQPHDDANFKHTEVLQLFAQHEENAADRHRELLAMLTAHKASADEQHNQVVAWQQQLEKWKLSVTEELRQLQSETDRHARAAGTTALEQIRQNLDRIKQMSDGKDLES
eukprot:CAMPEP_0175156252 /NCGR_PEP_ID=MMETSP0087-20121206/21485_1 /TAXON_ID=136419 /ORGANISM="Unknown Unknown, Strain D1" /LENGTH=227 /DNA_ID=CAMNT_0016443613 /DNA_START=129 /DNA_END=812 /DNA_ORIENTATION=-